MYPNLKILMVATPKPITQKELAKIINKTRGAITQKLQGKIEFKGSEVFKITEYFRQYFPSVTSDDLFSFELKETIVTAIKEYIQNQNKKVV